MEGADVKSNTVGPSRTTGGIWSDESLRFRFALFVLIVLFIPCLQFVHDYGVNVPFLDEWFFLQTYKDLQTHQIGWLDVLTHQHNVHRIGVAYAIEFILASISHCDSIWQMYLFATCRFLTAVVLLDLIRRERDDKQVPILFGVLLGMQLFSLRQF